MEFIGRKRELQELEERYQSGRFEMGVIYGARRIGKTSLLKKFSEDKPSLYFQARESSELDNRAAFSFTLNRLLGIPYELIYPTYSEAFDALIRICRRQALCPCVGRDCLFGPIGQSFPFRASI